MSSSLHFRLSLFFCFFYHKYIFGFPCLKPQTSTFNIQHWASLVISLAVHNSVTFFTNLYSLSFVWSVVCWCQLSLLSPIGSFCQPQFRLGSSIFCLYLSTCFTLPWILICFPFVSSSALLWNFLIWKTRAHTQPDSLRQAVSMVCYRAFGFWVWSIYTSLHR